MKAFENDDFKTWIELFIRDCSFFLRGGGLHMSLKKMVVKGGEGT